MIEILLILVVIYIAYVIYNDSDDSQTTDHQANNELSSKVPVNKVSAIKVEVVAAKQSAAENTEPVKATKTPPKPKANKLAAPKIELRTVMMKNPATGEEAKVAGNYRMVKRWIKEALVEEGLLEKIYKNKEMDDAAKVVVAEALSIIKAMDKYKVS